MKKILIMDDEEYNLKSFSLSLKSFGYDVMTASKGEEAIELYKRNSFDLVFLDLTIKNGMDGARTLKELQTINPGVIAIAFSGLLDDPIIINPQKYGFYSAIVKPFSPKNVDALIRLILE